MGGRGQRGRVGPLLTPPAPLSWVGFWAGIHRAGKPRGVTPPGAVGLRIRSRANLEIACQRIGERMNEWGMDPTIRSFVIHSVTGHVGDCTVPFRRLKNLPTKAPAPSPSLPPHRGGRGTARRAQDGDEEGSLRPCGGRLRRATLWIAPPPERAYVTQKSETHPSLVNVLFSVVGCLRSMLYLEIMLWDSFGHSAGQDCA